MGDHLDTLVVTPVDDDPRLGITDLYAFPSLASASADTSVLVLCVSPVEPPPATGFHPDGIYQFNVDTDGDAATDLAYNVTFSPTDGGVQVANVRRATGNAARNREANGEVVIHDARVSFDSRPAIAQSGPYRFFAGVRSDPFFADNEGFQNDLQFTGSDYFAGKNVLAIALEVPNGDLSPSPVGIWARTIVRRAAERLQVDRVGAPAINLGFNQGEDITAFNVLEPTEDRSHFLEKFVAILVERSGYADGDARGIAEQLLPDLLRFDHTEPPGFPNGRRLEDDVVDAGLALITQGRITSDLVDPHADYLADFPYLGPPNEPDGRTTVSDDADRLS